MQDSQNKILSTHNDCIGENTHSSYPSHLDNGNVVPGRGEGFREWVHNVLCQIRCFGDRC